MVGVYACGTVAAVLELAYTRALADTAGRSLVEVVNTTSYTTAPWVEELVKVSPLLLAGLYVKVRRQWGLTDFTVLGAALGAGFGLLEALLRYSLDVDRSLVRYGGWLVPDSLSPPYIPGPAGVFTSWLPAPAAALDLGPTGDVTVAAFSHLAWTAVTGLAVGILWRARGWWKPLAAVPFAAAVAHHTLTNYVIRHPGGHPERWLNSLDVKLWAAPVVALLLAMTADWACLHRAKSSLPDRGGPRPVQDPGRTSASAQGARGTTRRRHRDAARSVDHEPEGPAHQTHWGQASRTGPPRTGVGRGIGAWECAGVRSGSSGRPVRRLQGADHASGLVGVGVGGVLRGPEYSCLSSVDEGMVSSLISLAWGFMELRTERRNRPGLFLAFPVVDRSGASGGAGSWTGRPSEAIPRGRAVG
ncbi:hypothetical protein GCM10010260_70480 [Streptomyces filipinensis]|uniref:PrsW family intramembrane metalloprotease n=2 Tax=Streptomyces filipinensis TaxID=66887 RepID=A0A918IHY0_9ACTN|nr:hypothetical protein GCM10010260_70480 [Streptomyces filipinensis]